MNVKHISDLKLTALTSLDSTNRTLVSLYDNQVLVAHSEAQVLSQLSHFSVPRCEKLHRLIIEKQKSQCIYHPAVLEELLYKGYGSFVVKILLKLKELLEAKHEKLLDYLDMDLETFLVELKAQADGLAAQTSQPGQ